MSAVRSGEEPASGLARRARAAAALARRHDHVAAGLFLLALLIAYHWRLLTGDLMSESYVLYGAAPWNALAPAGLPPVRSGQGDAAAQFVPLLELARAQLGAGTVPLWNPDIYLGMPLLGDMQTALLYPLTWLALVFPAGDVVGPTVVLKLLTAGLGTYALARRLAIDRGGAVVAAVAFMLSAAPVGWAQVPLGTAISLLPWLLLVTDRVYRAPTRGRIAAVGAVVALELFTGHPETAWLSSSAAGVYLLALVVLDRDPARPLRARVRGALAWAGGHLLGALTAAVVLVPFMLALGESITAEAHGEFSDVHLPLWSTLLYVLPNAWGDGMPQYAGPLVYYLGIAGYVGIATLLLAGVALVLRRRDPRALGIAAMAIVTGMVLFGVAPVSWIVQVIPPYSSGNHSRTLFILALALALGAGAGVSLLRRRPLALRWVALAGGVLALAAAALYGINVAGDHLPELAGGRRGQFVHLALALTGGIVVLVVLGRRWRTLGVAVALVVIVADLSYLRDWNAILPERQANPPTPPVVRWLARQPERARLSAIWTTPLPPFTLTPNTTAGYGIEGIQGYDYPQPRRWSDFSWTVLGVRGGSREFVNTSPVPRGPALTALRMVNVRWYVAPPGAPNPNPRALRPAYRGIDATVFADRAALPRAYVVPRTRAATDAQALAVLTAGRLDPRAEALVPPSAPAPASRAPVSRGRAPAASRPARVVSRAPDRIEIDVPAGTAGWLVVGNAFSEQWTATVDGRDAELHPTDHVAMGLPLEPGRHRVVIELDRTPFIAGAVVSLAGLIALLALWAPWRRRRRAARGAPGARAPPR